MSEKTPSRDARWVVRMIPTRSEYGSGRRVRICVAHQEVRSVAQLDSGSREGIIEVREIAVVTEARASTIEEILRTDQHYFSARAQSICDALNAEIEVER